MINEMEDVVGAKTEVLPAEVLREFCTRVFLHFGCPKEDAEQAADVLVCADLRGIDSHGVARLHSYFELLSAGAINIKPRIEIIRSTMSTATVDGDNGLGLVVGPRANRIAMDLGENAGSGWVSVRNSNHFDIAGLCVESSGTRSDRLGDDEFNQADGSLMGCGANAWYQPDCAGSVTSSN